nr:TonB-dependent receptor [Bacteroidales bacterium]
MKRIPCILLLLAAILAGGELYAQDLVEVKRVELDSLVRFLRKEFQPDIYYVKDAAEQSTFSVSAPRAQFLEAAFDALREKGYVVSSYGSSRFILHSKSVFTSLPSGYFDDGKTSHLVNDSGLQQYLAEQSAIVTFQNKIYEIGESNAGRRGKVYVSGHVRDISSGEPLTGVSVYDEKTGAYAVTDAAGFYRVALPVGDNQLNLSGYSLDDMHLNLRVWDDGVLDVVMKEKVLALTGAVISADAVSHHRDAKMGIERVRMEVINKIPSAFGEGDIIKAVLTLPGVKSVGEASSGFNVRGGSTDQNLVLFNDGTIYNPTHLFGIFSAFNPDIVSEVELYKSSIPAEFGGRISSVLDVRTREGNANKVAGSLGIGLLTSRLHLEGPLVKGKTTFIVGGRTTYSNWMMKLLPQTSEYSGGKASFSDVNASVTHKVDDANTLQAFIYWSRDGFEFSRDPAFRYSNLNGSLKWRSRLGSRLNLTAVAGYDRYGARLENSLGKNQMSGYSVDTQINQGFAKLNFRYAATDAHDLSFGLNATYYNLQPGAMAPLYEGESLVRTWALDRQHAVEPALFASDSWTLSSKLTLEGGIRLSGLLALHPAKFYLTPEFRLSGKYSFLDNLPVKAGLNTMSQHIHLISNTSSFSPFDTWQLSTDRIRPQTGWQAAAGLYWTSPDGTVDL